MVAGDPIIYVGSIPAGSSVDITLTERCKLIAIATNTRTIEINIDISTDGGSTFYNIGVVGLFAFSVLNSGGTNIHFNTSGSLFLPANTIIRLTNTNTSADRTYLLNVLEY